MEISVVVLTKNEEKNIESCLRTLDWCDETIVVDDYSSDKTVERAEKLKAKVYKRKLGGDFAGQRNFGLKKAKGEWVLFIDVDERVSEGLQAEIKEKIKSSPECQAYFLKRKVKFLGRWLKYGETGQAEFLRLARKGAGKWRGRVHEKWQIKGKKRILKEPLIHQQDITLQNFVKRLNFYSSLRARELWEQGKRFNFFELLIFPPAKFIQNFFLRLGFLDGRPGLILALLMSFHSFWVRAKLFMLGQKKDNPPREVTPWRGLPLVLLILTLPFGQLTRMSLFFPEVHIYLHDLVVVLLLVWGLVKKRFNWRRIFEDNLTKPILSFFLVAILSLLVNFFRYQSFEVLIGSFYLWRWLAYAFVYWLAREHFQSNPEEKEKFYKLLICSTVVLAIFGFCQYFLFPDFRPLAVYHWDPHYYRLLSTFFDPAFTAMFLVLGLILLVTKFPLGRKPEKYKFIIHNSLFLILYIALALTYSRSAYLAYLIGFLIISIKKKTPRLFFGILFLGLVTVLLLPRPGGEGVRLERTTSIQARLINWQQGIQIFKDQPVFGVGFNTLRYTQRDYGFLKEEWQETHSAAGLDSSLLFVLASTGVVGFIAYGYFLKRVFLGQSLVIKALMASLISHSLFNNTLFYSPILLWLWLILALEVKDNRRL